MPFCKTVCYKLGHRWCIYIKRDIPFRHRWSSVLSEVKLQAIFKYEINNENITTTQKIWKTGPGGLWSSTISDGLEHEAVSLDKTSSKLSIKHEIIESMKKFSKVKMIKNITLTQK